VTSVPTIEITRISPQLQNMDTVDDIDEDEAFINELMALHPNDEDIIVEDLEFRAAPNDNNNTISSDNNSDLDGVRNVCYCVLPLVVALSIFRSLHTILTLPLPVDLDLIFV
jgi:hypothetical protein